MITSPERGADHSEGVAPGNFPALALPGSAERFYSPFPALSRWRNAHTSGTSAELIAGLLCPDSPGVPSRGFHAAVNALAIAGMRMPRSPPPACQERASKSTARLARDVRDCWREPGKGGWCSHTAGDRDHQSIGRWDKERPVGKVFAEPKAVWSCGCTCLHRADRWEIGGVVHLDAADVYPSGGTDLGSGRGWIESAHGESGFARD
jgi:hypothetical protein